MYLDSTTMQPIEMPEATMSQGFLCFFKLAFKQDALSGPSRPSGNSDILSVGIGSSSGIFTPQTCKCLWNAMPAPFTSPPQWYALFILSLSHMSEVKNIKNTFAFHIFLYSFHLVTALQF
jgi:hypothetical protein